MPRIASERYREFLETGFIRFLTLDELERILEEAGKWKKDGKMARAFMILLYYTGRRPSELLDLTVRSIKVTKKHVIVTFPTRKHGRASTIYLPRSKRFMNEFIKYYEEFKRKYGPRGRLFYLLESKGSAKTSRANKVTILVRRWTQRALGEAIPPYFFRHNIMSLLAQNGVDLIDLMIWKGAKSAKSVSPYIHMSGARAQKIARILAKVMD